MSHFSGYASVTEHPYDMGPWDEVIARGAFAKSLAESPDVQLNLSHGTGGSGLPIARTDRNMTLAEDERGLLVHADLDDDDPDVQLLTRKFRNGLISAMSFAFVAVRERFENDYTLRRITEASIHQGDVTVCPLGANPAAGVVSLRSAADLRGPGRESAARRGRLASRVGKAVALEMRSIELDGVPYTFRAGGEKYTQAEIDELGRQGKAFQHKDGRYSFPIADEEDVRNAVRAVGGRADPEEKTAIRRFIMKRARALGLADLIPDTWAADGTLKAAGRSLVRTPFVVLASATERAWLDVAEMRRH